MRRLAKVLGWGFIVALLLLGVLFIFRQPLLSRLGIRLPSGNPGVTEISLPEGFNMTVFAEGLSDPRFMVVGPDGTVFVAERGKNQVVALPYGDQDEQSGDKVVIAEDLDRPSSLTFRPGTNELYIGETTRVTRLSLDGTQVLERDIVIDGLPGRRLHFTTTVLFGADGALYVSMGSSCNVCLEQDERLAAVSRYEADGTRGRLFTTGLRNAVGLALNPVTDEVWATNNGRDLLGNDQPPETVYVLREGADAGWPRCHAGSIVDPKFGSKTACEGVAAPVITDTAHSAPLGAVFYTGDMFPEEYRDNLFIAYHGSWNRTPPTGYKVVRVPMEGGEVAGEPVDFASGWLSEDGSSTGRPVGVVVAEDGALLISDDKAGVIYRVSYDSNASTAR